MVLSTAPRPPLGSQGGDELRQLQLLPLLSLGEGPGQGCTIVLAGSCEPWACEATAPGAMSQLVCPGRSGGSRALAMVQFCTRSEKVSPESHLPREQGLASSTLLAALQPGSCGEGQGDVTAMGKLLWLWLCPRGISPHPRSPEEPRSRSPPSRMAPSPSCEEAHLLRQSHDSRSWCFRKHVQISVWLKYPEPPETQAGRSQDSQQPRFCVFSSLCCPGNTSFKITDRLGHNCSAASEALPSPEGAFSIPRTAQQLGES